MNAMENSVNTKERRERVEMNYTGDSYEHDYRDAGVHK